MTAGLVVLASGNGSNLQAVIDACAAGRLPAEVSLVVSDRSKAHALQRARAAGIPARHLPVVGRERREYDKELGEVVAAAEPAFVVLAGWMRILTSEFLDRFPNRVVNLHPALPGEFPGMHAIERAHAAFGAGELERTGVMVHLVPDEEVDSGPVVATAEVPIRVGDSLEDLTERVHETEHDLLIEALAGLLSGEEVSRPAEDR